jgi:hypothetical protein
VLVQRGSVYLRRRNSLFGSRVRVLIGASTTGKLWKIANQRRAKFSVWFSGEGPDWCLHSGEAVENCEPVKGEILGLFLGCGS